jgi:hypothetical protein
LARDGLVCVRNARPPKVQYRPKVAEKLACIIARNYIATGFVTNVIDFFAVPKGEDIRLLYNGTSYRLNSSLWAPNIWLPYPRSAMQLIDFGYF